MIKESAIREVIVKSGLTYSPEAGDDYPMKTVPLSKVVDAVVSYLKETGIMVLTDEHFVGSGKRKYYLMRAQLARDNGNDELATSYEMQAEALPWGFHEVID